MVAKRRPTAAASGRHQQPSHDERRRRTPPSGRAVLFAVGSIVVAWGAAVVVLLLLARADLRHAMRLGAEARANTTAADLAEHPPLDVLRDAQSHFTRGRRRIDNPLLAPARHLPVLGRQLRSASALSGAASEVAETLAEALEEANVFLHQPRPSGPARVELVRRIESIADRTGGRLGEIDLGPNEHLLSPLADAYNELADQIYHLRVALHDGATVARAVGQFLSGPRRYLVLAANNAEMRAGSGMILSVGELQATGGTLALSELESVVDLPVGDRGPPLVGDVAERWGWLRPNQDWTSLMVSPRFDVMAPLAAQMWANTGHAPVDGVLTLDPVALRGFLLATGPLTVDGRRIDAGNVVDELLHRQYLGLQSREEQLQRQDALGRVARAAFEALNTGSWSAARLAEGLAGAGRGRHLLAWSGRQEEQAGWQAAGIDGSLTQDSLLVGLLNRAGNKLDRFVEVSARLDVHRARGSEIDVSVELLVKNSAPVGLPSYVAGPYPGSGVGEGVYLAILAVSMPAASTGGHVDGVKELAVAGADGPTRVVAIQFALARGEERRVVVRFRLPPTQRAIQVEPSARVPPIRWSSQGASWSDDVRRLIVL